MMKTKHLMSLLIGLGVSAPGFAVAGVPEDLEKELRGYLDELQESDDPHAVEASLLTMGRFADRSDRDKLAEYKSDASQRVKYGAGAALMMSRVRGAGDFMEAQIAGDGSLYLSLREVLSVLPDRSEKTLLKAALKSAEGPTARDIFRYLAHQHGPLYEMLKGYVLSRDDELRGQAVQAVVSTARPSAIGFAKEMIRSRRGAVKKDGAKLAVALSYESSLAESAAPLLRDIVDDMDGEEALKASRRLVELGDARGARHLVGTLSGDEEVSVKLERVRFLLAQGADVDGEAAKKLMESTEDEQLKEALHELVAASGDVDIWEDVASMFASTEFSERLKAARLMGHLGDKRALPSLGRAMFEGSDELRLAAARSLGQLEHKDAVQPLKRALQRERNREVKLAVIEAFAKIDAPESVTTLRFQTMDRDPAVKKAVVSALRGLGRPDGVGALSVLLRDRDKSIRWGAFIAALELDPENSSGFMASALRNPPDSFMADIDTLSPKTRQRVLEFMLSEGTDQVRGEALAAFTKLDDSGLDIARELVLDSSVKEEVRRELLLALSEKRAEQDKALFERVVRDSESKELKRMAAWTLTEYATDDLEATFRGYLNNPDVAIRGIGVYGLATVKD